MKITNAPAPILGPITRPSLLLLVGLEEGASEGASEGAAEGASEGAAEGVAEGAAEGQDPHSGFVPLSFPK